jgi:hypothetical protein
MAQARLLRPIHGGDFAAPQYAFIQSLYSDNHYTSEEYGKQLDEITDKTLKQRLKTATGSMTRMPGP